MINYHLEGAITHTDCSISAISRTLGYYFFLPSHPKCTPVISRLVTLSLSTLGWFRGKQVWGGLMGIPQLSLCATTARLLYPCNSQLREQRWTGSRVKEKAHLGHKAPCLSHPRINRNLARQVHCSCLCSAEETNHLLQTPFSPEWKQKAAHGSAVFLGY